MKRNTLTTAVLAGLTGMAGMVSVSNAVNVNPDGLGQVLLFPYYTARGGNDTVISIVNTTDRGKAVKIRFIEALNSREVLDFNIYLSPFDVWTAAVTATDAGGAKMVTRDTTCTVPYFFGDSDDGVGEQVFLDFQYNAAAVPSVGFEGTIDGGPSGIERTASGYIEVIEMGTLAALSSESNPESGDPRVADWVKHGSNGLPADCNSVVNLWRETAPNANPAPGGLGFWRGQDTNGNPVDSDPNFGFDTTIGASGGLVGSASIINVQQGTLFSYNATAIDGFWNQGTTRHTDPGDLLPNLSSNNNQESIVFNNGALQAIDWDFEGSPLAINATLTLAELLNEYNIESGLGARTEWVLTFPTKAFHVDGAPGANAPLVAATGAAVPPFTSVWTVDSPNSCDTLAFRFWDREEQEPVEEPGSPGGVGVSPPAPPSPVPEVPVFQLCREANVIRFTNDGSEPDATEILAEPLRDGAFELLSYTNFDLPEGFQSGWMRFDFSSRESLSGTPTIGNDNAVRGLPVIGFGVTTFQNGDLGSGVRSNYGGSFQHRGTRQGFFID